MASLMPAYRRSAWHSSHKYKSCGLPALSALSLLVEPGAPENTDLIFEVISSNDPTGCALARQNQIVSLVTNCACNLAIEAEFSDESCYQCQNGNIDLIISNGKILNIHGLMDRIMKI